jgi:hypothetical protein
MRAICRGGFEHVEDPLNRVCAGRFRANGTEPDGTRTEVHLQKLNDKKKHRLNGVFTACAAVISLLKTVTDAAIIVGRKVRIMLSTARSSFDEFQNARKCGQKLYIWAESISWGQSCVHPNISGEPMACLNFVTMNTGIFNFSFRAFLREKHEANHSITQTSITERTLPAPNQ